MIIVKQIQSKAPMLFSRCSAFALLLFLLWAVPLTAYAEETPAYSEAGWFNGSYSATMGDMAGRRLYVYGIADPMDVDTLPEKDSDLRLHTDFPATRLEVAEMIYRICADTEVIEICPFMDVPEKYAPAVGWLYQNGITHGVSEELFGTGEVTKGQFLTMLSRLLSWEIQEDDIWNGDYNDLLMVTAEEHGLIPVGISKDSFAKGDVYLILLELARNEHPEICVPVRPEMSRPQKMILRVSSFDDAETQILSAMQFAPSRIEVLFPVDVPSTEIQRFAAKYDSADGNYDAFSSLISYLDSEFGGYYAFSKRSERAYVLYFSSYAPAYLTWLDMSDWLRCFEDEAYSRRIQDFVETKIISLAPKNTSDYTKVRLAQELICEQATYDWAEYDAIKWKNTNVHLAAHSISGFLNNGIIVCDGYAKTLQWVLRCLDVDCFVVYGVTKNNNDNHAWNKVKIDGKWYNIDICWRDTGSGELFFLKSDDYFQKNQHQFKDDYVLSIFSSPNSFSW